MTEWVKGGWKEYQIGYSHGESNNPMKVWCPPQSYFHELKECC